MGILWRAPKFISKFASSESGVITADFRKVVRPSRWPLCPSIIETCPMPNGKFSMPCSRNRLLVETGGVVHGTIGVPS